MDVYSDLSSIKGVGPKTKEMFCKCNIFNILDLLLYFPRDYEIINVAYKNGIVIDKKNIIKVKVVKIYRDVKKNNKIVTSIVLSDGVNTLYAKWFNQPYIKSKFRMNSKYILVGKIEKYNNKLYIINPKIVNNNVEFKGIEPKYALKGKITNTILRKTIAVVLKSMKIKENLPLWIIKKYKFCDLDTAINSIHNPNNTHELREAIRRLKFQEMFTYCVKLFVIKDYVKKNKEGIDFTISDELKELKNKLPYKLTKSQNKVTREILLDGKKSSPMNRLVQGDVGSGKTIVSIIAMFNVVKNGYQVAMMVPTEILANQHFHEVTELLNEFNVKVELLTSSVNKKKKEKIKEKLRQGKIDIIIGTHALIQDDVEFRNLGLVVTDEQHRFGVMQRNKLTSKGINVDILVMSATPIPRTLSLFLYGDLDVSIIDELPPGRKKVDTYFVTKSYKERVYNFALKQINLGRQVYVVCPLVEENDKLNIMSVESLYEELKEKYFYDINVEILHGKMNNKDKEEVMNNFKKGITKVLISTTVIEVGVNVPNAALMIIENAERFGLAQLHQLRGRVGRGDYKSYCILIADIKNNITRKRMEIIQNSNDGFYISEEDLKIRGSGEIFGFKQHGDNGFILSNIIEDAQLLKKANNEAKILFNSTNVEDLEVKQQIIKKIEESSKYICFN
ncbi:ATP-dependent DNA helicase RecG [Haloimpatiens sp. FM7330]|uniref:ATP-dependent DNA helicase RecG n=1 Tax=Haloimpatiens sp. FM7330 TaxID=3298610 RepID=UPI00363C6857